MISKRLAIGTILTVASLANLADGFQKLVLPAAPVPKPEWSPGQVVEFQLVALQFNDRPTRDAGIATTFRFASPGNRELTGPLARFTQIVRAPGYLPLIDHRIAGYGDMAVQGNLAIRRVTVVAADGQAIEYEFRLSKDPESGCWFTDGVIPIPKDAPIDPNKIASNP